MLRIKRSVQATYNTNVNYMSAQMIAAAGATKLPGEGATAGDTMAVLEAKAQLVWFFFVFRTLYYLSGGRAATKEQWKYFLYSRSQQNYSAKHYRESR